MLITTAQSFQRIEDRSRLAEITALDVNINFRDNSLKFQFRISRITNVSPMFFFVPEKGLLWLEAK